MSAFVSLEHDSDCPFMVAMSIVAMGMCHAAEPGVAPADALVCDPVTGRFRDGGWRRRLDLDPVRLLPRHAAGLAALRLFHLDVGERDEYGMHWGVRALHAALTEHGVSHGYHEHPGGHHGIEYVFVDALAELTRIWPLEPSLKRGGAGCAA
jgi:hypothetical protein